MLPSTAAIKFELSTRKRETVTGIGEKMQWRCFCCTLFFLTTISLIRRCSALTEDSWTESTKTVLIRNDSITQQQDGIKPTASAYFNLQVASETNSTFGLQSETRFEFSNATTLLLSTTAATITESYASFQPLPTPTLETDGNSTETVPQSSFPPTVDTENTVSPITFTSTATTSQASDTLTVSGTGFDLTYNAKPSPATAVTTFEESTVNNSLAIETSWLTEPTQNFEPTTALDTMGVDTSTLPSSKTFEPWSYPTSSTASNGDGTETETPSLSLPDMTATLTSALNSIGFTNAVEVDNLAEAVTTQLGNVNSDTALVATVSTFAVTVVRSDSVHVETVKVFDLVSVSVSLYSSAAAVETESITPMFAKPNANGSALASLFSNLTDNASNESSSDFSSNFRGVSLSSARAQFPDYRLCLSLLTVPFFAILL